MRAAQASGPGQYLTPGAQVSGLPPTRPHCSLRAPPRGCRCLGTPQVSRNPPCLGDAGIQGPPSGVWGPPPLRGGRCPGPLSGVQGTPQGMQVSGDPPQASRPPPQVSRRPPRGCRCPGTPWKVDEEMEGWFIVFIDQD